MIYKIDVKRDVMIVQIMGPLQSGRQTVYYKEQLYNQFLYRSREVSYV